MINEKYPESELTGKIIGCCMEVHRIPGNGFQEIIYQRALAIEMNQQKISYSREHEMEIFYKGEAIGTRRVDFFIEGKINVGDKSTYSFGRCSSYAGYQLPGSIKWTLVY